MPRATWRFKRGKTLMGIYEDEEEDDFPEDDEVVGDEDF